MNVLKGYRTYITVIITMMPEAINFITTGVATGQTAVVIGFGLLALVFRKLADTPK